MLRIIAENLPRTRSATPGHGATLHPLGRRARAARPCSPPPTTGSASARRDLPRLFERFWRADAARASRGTGLGLAIVKHVVTAAGGTVEAASELGSGLEVRCSFPE